MNRERAVSDSLPGAGGEVRAFVCFLLTCLGCCCLSTGIATLARRVQAVIGSRVEMCALVDAHARRGRGGRVDEIRAVRKKRRGPRIVRFRRYPVAAAHEGQGCRPPIPLPLCAGCVKGESDSLAQGRISSRRPPPVRFCVFLCWLASIFLRATSPFARRSWARSRSTALRTQEKHGAAFPACEAAWERNRCRRPAFGRLFCSFRPPAPRMRVVGGE
jgi:hypothetical protein